MMDEEIKKIVEGMKRETGKIVWYSRTPGQHNFGVVMETGRFYGGGIPDEKIDDEQAISGLTLLLKSS